MPNDLLTEPQKSEIRRHLGYPEPATALNFPGGPPYSATFGQAGAHIGDRFTPAFYDLEYRLIDIPETGLVEILGADASAFPGYSSPANAYINVATAGSSAAVAGTLPLQIGTEATSVAVTVGLTPAQIAADIIAAINALTIAPTLVVAVATATAGQVLVESRVVGNAMNTFALRAWGNGDTTFTITDTSSSPAATLALRGGTDPPGPKFSNPDTTPPQMIFGHLPIIRYWESQIPNAADGMDTRQAGKFIQEPREYAKRRVAYISACRDMAQTLAVVYYGTKNYRGQSGIRREY